MGGRKPLMLVVGGLLAALFLVGLALGSGAAPADKPAPADKRKCGAPWDAPGFEVPARWYVVPNVVCMDLQLAQDKMQAAAFDNVRAQDQAGNTREQFYDREWAVVAQTPAAGTRGESNTPVRLTTVRYGDPGAPAAPDRTTPGRVPKMTCFDLQEAQDTLQAAGFTNVVSEDASTSHRHQWFDRNWTVVGQRPGPGSASVSKATEIVLRVLKDRDLPHCP